VDNQEEIEKLKCLVKELEKENSKQHKKYVQLEAKLDAQRISLNNRIKELELRKNPMEHNELTDREIARRIAFVLYKGGLDAKGNPIDGEDPL
jgi:hypothetical protein